MDRLVYIDGEFVTNNNAVVSIYNHGLLYGDGAFEGVRVYSGRIFKLQEHLERLYRSVHAMNFSLPQPIESLFEAIVDLVGRNDRQNGYIRVTATRGTGLGLDPKVCQKASIIASTDSLSLYPPEMYSNGLTVVTVSTRMPSPDSFEPRIKSLGKYVCNIQAKLEANRVGAGEGLMLNQQGYVAEATGDNIFIVKNGELITPPSWAGILEGITRNTVMELAAAEGITVRQDNLTLYDVYSCDECFLTGTAAELIPVAVLDGRRIGEACPGPVTTGLMASFRHLTATEGTLVQKKDAA